MSSVCPSVASDTSETTEVTITPGDHTASVVRMHLTFIHAHTDRSHESIKDLIISETVQSNAHQVCCEDSLPPAHPLSLSLSLPPPPPSNDSPGSPHMGETIHYDQKSTAYIRGTLLFFIVNNWNENAHDNNVIVCCCCCC